MRILQLALLILTVPTLALPTACGVADAIRPDQGSEEPGEVAEAPITQGNAMAATPSGAAGAGCAPSGDPWTVANLNADLGFLAAPNLAGRVPASPGGIAARTFVADRFRCLGLQPGGANGSYLQPFEDSEGSASANVVGILPGSDPVVGSDVVIIGAHIDHFGKSDPEECSGLCLGANDNASGVSTVLAIARAMAQRGTAPRRTLAFMIFDSEERGCEGSQFYIANSLPSLPLSRVVYNLNFDMVGSYTQWGRKVVAHGTVANTPGLAEIRPLVGPSGLNVEIEAPGVGVDDSDYGPFCGAGIPVVGFFTHDPSCYHESCDTIDKIDFPNLSKIVKLASDLTGRLGDTTTDLAAFRKAASVKNLGCSGYKNPAEDDD